MTVPYLIYSTPDGEIREEPRLQALTFGDQLLDTSSLIPLPDGVTLSICERRLRLSAGHDWSQGSSVRYTLPHNRRSEKTSGRVLFGLSP